MKRSLFSLLLAGAVWPGGRGLAGDSFNNGGGLAEANITYIWMTLESYLQTCLTVDACAGDAAAQTLIKEIADAAPAERASSLPLFQTATAIPGLFEAAGEERPFQTDPRPLAPVTYNLDLIYARDPVLGTIQPLQVDAALALVFEAMSHHHGRTWDDPEVAAAAARLQALSASSTTELHLGGEGEAQIYAQVVALPGDATLLVSSGQDLVNVTLDFVTALAASGTPGAVAAGFSNLRFGELESYGEGARLPLRGTLSVKAGGAVPPLRDFTITIYFKVDPTSRALSFDHDEVRL